jgi:transposase, IS5 family
MLRDRYEPMDLFERVPELGLKMEPELTHLDSVLDDDVLYQEVRADLARRHPHTLETGRPSTPVEVILRLLIVKHLYNWSYAQTEHWVNDSLVLRQFCRLYLQPVPEHTTLLRWANLLQPATLHRLLDRVVQLARERKVTRGRKLRTDGTVVETNIAYPTDSGLLGAGVRVLSRLLKGAAAVLGNVAGAGRLFRDRTRSAKRRVKQIADSVRQRGEQLGALRQQVYGELIQITQASVRQAQQVRAALMQQAGKVARKLREQLDTFLPRVERVIAQTVRRVLHGEQVPAEEKLVSLFEPETAIICKGKPRQPTEFGRAVWLDEVDGGIVSRYEVLTGNPADSGQIRPGLDHHQRVFKKPPHLLVGDRGTHSATNEKYARAVGVKQVVLPKPGAKSAERRGHERERWFRRGQAWRAGIEGRISVLKRGYGLERCRNHGDAGMERWVGLGIIAHNLHKIAQAAA